MGALFVYGTLLCEAVTLRVIGRQPEAEPAILSGFGRFRIRGESFPGIRKGDGEVSGALWRDLTPVEMDMLDGFEGEMYRRSTVAVCAGSDESVAAETYVLRDSFLSKLSLEPWSLEVFEKRYLKSFLSAAWWSEM